jgi:hypothetical protein
MQTIPRAPKDRQRIVFPSVLTTIKNMVCDNSEGHTVLDLNEIEEIILVLALLGYVKLGDLDETKEDDKE